jgi:hypothetical protein
MSPALIVFLTIASLLVTFTAINDFSVQMLCFMFSLDDGLDGRLIDITLHNRTNMFSEVLVNMFLDYRCVLSAFDPSALFLNGGGIR